MPYCVPHIVRAACLSGVCCIGNTLVVRILKCNQVVIKDIPRFIRRNVEPSYIRATEILNQMHGFEALRF